jgi:hypothetical protein
VLQDGGEPTRIGFPAYLATKERQSNCRAVPANAAGTISRTLHALSFL